MLPLAATPTFVSRHLLIVAALVALQVPFLLTHHIQEDAYISFRCAVNLADHGVYGFNPSERVSASTSHARVALLAALRRLAGDRFIALAQLIDIAAVVAGTFLLATALTADPKRRDRLWCCGALLPSALISGYGGMETGLLVATIGLCCYVACDETPGRLVSIAAFALLPWIRPDAIAMGLLIALPVAARVPRRAAMLATTLLISGVTWLLFNKWWFGDYVTQTMIGKAAVMMSDAGHFWGRGISTLEEIWFGGAAVPGMFVPLQTRYLAALSIPAWALVGAAAAWMVSARPTGFRRDAVRILTLIAFLPPVLYAFSGIVSPWYLWPSQIAGGLIVFAALAALAARTSRWHRPLAHSVLAAVGIVALGQWLFAMSWGTQEYVYRGGIGRDLRARAPAGATLLLEPAGYIPYFSGLYTWEEIGLATPSVTDYRHRYGLAWWPHFVADHQPTFLVERDYLRDGVTLDGYRLTADERDWFDRTYERVHTYRYELDALDIGTVRRSIARLGSAREYDVYQHRSPRSAVSHVADVR